MLLSLVVHLARETHRLAGLREGLASLRRALPYPFEVVAVVDPAASWATRRAAGPTWQVLEQEERGRGPALRLGMQVACGRYRAVVDPAWTVASEQLQLLLPPALSDFDVAVASRHLSGSTRRSEPWTSFVVGRAFNRLTRAIALPGIHDTHCGYTIFRAEAAHALFARSEEMGWGVDLEVLALARAFGLAVREVPVDWDFDPEARKSLSFDGPDLLASMLRVRARLAAGDVAPLVGPHLGEPGERSEVHSA